MYAAVTIAMALMLLASKPLTRFVNKHPTVVVLCLGFLMIGFSLVAEGLGYKIPKGYLYAAIAFDPGRGVQPVGAFQPRAQRAPPAVPPAHRRCRARAGAPGQWSRR